MAVLAAVPSTCVSLEKRGDDFARVVFQPDNGSSIELIVPAQVANALSLNGRYELSLADIEGAAT